MGGPAGTGGSADSGNLYRRGCAHHIIYIGLRMRSPVGGWAGWLDHCAGVQSAGQCALYPDSALQPAKAAAVDGGHDTAAGHAEEIPCEF